jgi:hypothetical protein
MWRAGFRRAFGTKEVLNGRAPTVKTVGYFQVLPPGEALRPLGAAEEYQRMGRRVAALAVNRELGAEGTDEMCLQRCTAFAGEIDAARQ